MIGLSIIVPCYNEASRSNFEERIDILKDYINSLPILSEIIFVTDGCTDNTVDIIRGKGFRPISYRKNKGKGYAVKYAIKYCNFDSILIMDADLSVGLENIELFYNQCSQGNMIIGTRVYNKSKRSKIRRFISFCSNICVHKLIGVSVKDSQCGFKMFNIQDYNKISKYLRSNRWLLDMELLLYQKSQGVNIIEIPVDWKNDPDSTLKGKEAIKSSLRELIIILKERKANVKEIKDL